MPDYYDSAFNPKSLKKFSEAEIRAKKPTAGPRAYNAGNSDYSKHQIQPWDIWLEYKLNPWDADIIKRVLRTKQGEPRRLDYEKIVHVCQERIRQLDLEVK